MTAAELSRVTGIDQATISRWKNGAQLSIPSDDLHIVAKAITGDPAEQARLTLAHMLDICQGPGADQIDIQIRKTGLRESVAKKYEPGWPPMTPKFERALRVLATYADQTEVRDIVQSLADILEPEPEPKSTPPTKRRPIRLGKEEKN